MTVMGSDSSKASSLPVRGSEIGHLAGEHDRHEVDERHMRSKAGLSC